MRGRDRSGSPRWARPRARRRRLSAPPRCFRRWRRTRSSPRSSRTRAPRRRGLGQIRTVTRRRARRARTPWRTTTAPSSRPRRCVSRNCWRWDAAWPPARAPTTSPPRVPGCPRRRPRTPRAEPPRRRWRSPRTRPKRHTRCPRRRSSAPTRSRAARRTARRGAAPRPCLCTEERAPPGSRRARCAPARRCWRASRVRSWTRAATLSVLRPRKPPNAIPPREIARTRRRRRLCSATCSYLRRWTNARR
mmetsp:Transcript_7913/g.33090  ORF Transcript_7913/g.33090 Transcript_7913/m.33090 type:complete len:248 (-) Transcript_7913:866-1609(-)